MPLVTLSFEDHGRDIPNEVLVVLHFLPRIGEVLTYSEIGYEGMWKVTDICHAVSSRQKADNDIQETFCTVYLEPDE